MEKKYYAVWNGKIPEEMVKFLELNHLTSVTTLRVRVRRPEMRVDEKGRKEILSLRLLFGATKIELMALNPKPELEVVIGDTE